MALGIWKNIIKKSAEYQLKRIHWQNDFNKAPRIKPDNKYLWGTVIINCLIALKIRSHLLNKCLFFISITYNQY